MTSTSHGKADLTGLCVLIAEDDFLLAMSLEASVASWAAVSWVR